MANFIFNWATAALAAATLDLSTGNYYAHLVTTVPALGHSTVADLVLPTVSGYASTTLTGLSYNSTRWTFGSFNFPKYSFVSAPTGVVICKRNGATPATTDGIVCYSDFNNSIGQGISLQVGAYVVNLQFGSNGAINFSYRYQYNSGAYINNESVPKGLVYLLGTNNNTASYINPQPSKIASRFSYSGGVGVSGASATNRNATDFSPTPVRRISFYFYDRQVRVGSFGYNSSINNSDQLQLFGSNSLTAHTDIEIGQTSLWTLLGSIPSISNSEFNFINSTNSTFWSYLKIEAAVDNIVFGDFEFYGSSIISPTVNLV